MDIEIYLVPPGNRDFKNSLLSRVLKDTEGHDYSGIFCIAPTRHMLNHWRKLFHETAGRCYVPPSIMTLKQLSKMLCLTYGDKAIIPKALIPVILSELTSSGMGLASITAEFITELKHHYPEASLETIRETLINAFEELAIPDEVSKRTLHALQTFKQYSEVLDARNAIDDDDTLALAASFAGHLNIKTLFLDGFYEITQAEELLIKNLVKATERTFVTIPISDINDDLSYCYVNSLKDYFKVEPVILPADSGLRDRCFHSAPSMEEELEGMARHIKASSISGRLREMEDVFLVFPTLSDYRNMLERVFRRYGIPYHMTSPGPVLRKRPYRDLLSLLEAVSEGYPRLAFSTFLTSPFFRKGVGDLLAGKAPKICLNPGVIKGKDSWLKAFRNEGPDVHAAGVKVFKKLKPLEKIKARAPYGDFVIVLHGILKTFEFSPEDSSIEEVFNALNLLDSILQQETDFSGFIDSLRRILEYTLEETEGAGVQVSELLQVRGLDPGFLYMGGLKDGDIPSRPDIDFLLPDSVRGRLGLVDMKRYLLLQEYVFNRLTASSGGLRLSYPSMDGHKFFLPSLFLSGWEEKEEKLFGVFSKQEDMARKGKTPFSDHIKEARGIRRLREGSYINVTDIDYYRACPRRFFIEKMLGLQPPQVKEYEVDPVLMGSIVHEVMEKLISSRVEEFEILRERAAGLLDAALLKYPLEPYWKALIKESFLGILPEILKIEDDLRAEGYCFGMAELPVEGEPVKGIKLRGKIDRIDIKGGNGPVARGDGLVALIDYKTGGANLSSSGILKKGESLQLLLYAALLRAAGMKPERVGIYALKDTALKWIPGQTDRKKGRTLNEYIESALKFLEETAGNMQGGDFTALPLNDQICRRCYERPYCPYIQKGVNDPFKRVNNPSKAN